MQFTSILAATILSTVALAAPTQRAAAKSMAAADNSEWTFTSVTRACDDADTSCAWSFGIEANDGTAATPCAFTVTGSPASQASESGVQCGAYFVTSGWSGQFGPGNGFTTISVNNGSFVAFPSYTDTELAGGQPVSPDRSYPIQAVA